MKKMLIVALLAVGVFSLSACNTMSGAGKDIQKGGEKIENAADKNKQLKSSYCNVALDFAIQTPQAE